MDSPVSARRPLLALRLFCALLLLMQVPLFVLFALAAAAESPIGGGLTALFQGLLCLPLLQLLLQRGFLPEGFWAGVLGVSVAATAALLPWALLLTIVPMGMPMSPAGSPFRGLVALFVVEQLACMLAMAVLVFASPQLWKPAA